MRIYIDFDDVLCETARELSLIAARLYGRNVEYEQIGAFNLQRSFGLGRDEYLTLMEAAHSPSTLLNLAPTPHAAATVADWVARGHQVEIVTGRPFSTREPSQAWLEANGLKGIELVHVDKFNRELAPDDGTWDRSLTLDELSLREYDLAIEDAPTALRHLATMSVGRVIVFDRPWNQDKTFPDSHFRRVGTWREIAAMYP